MALFTEEDKDSLKGDNNKSFGTRFGLKFDPTYYLLKALGLGDKYAEAINWTGDNANKVMSKAAEPMFSLSRKYTPGREDGNNLDQVLSFGENKPASVTGLLIGGAAGGSALGIGGGGAGAGGGASGGATGGASGGSAGGYGEMIRNQVLKQGGAAFQEAGKPPEQQPLDPMQQAQRDMQRQKAQQDNLALEMYAQMLTDQAPSAGLRFS